MSQSAILSGCACGSGAKSSKCEKVVILKVTRARVVVGQHSRLLPQQSVSSAIIGVSDLPLSNCYPILLLLVLSSRTDSLEER